MCIERNTVLGSAALLCLLCAANSLAAKQDPTTEPIRLMSRNIHPEAQSAGFGRELESQLQADSLVRVHTILQFRRALGRDGYQALERAGIVLVDWLARNVYVAAIPSGTDLSAGELGSLLRWGEIIQPEDKRHPDLRKEPLDEWVMVEATDRLRVIAVFFSDVSEAEVEAAFAKLSLSGSLYGANNSWLTEASMEQIDVLLSWDIIACIAPMLPPPEDTNAGARLVARTEQAQAIDFPGLFPVVPTFRGVSGKRVRIGISEIFGIDEDHIDFKKLNAPGNRFYRSDPAAGTHGTHVASIAAGNGLASLGNGYPAYSKRGHAPEALLGDLVPLGGSVALYADAINDALTNLTNHTYKQSNGPFYGVNQASIDRIIRGDAWYEGHNIPSQPQVWTAGNHGRLLGKKYEGYYAVRSAAKNSISVGSVDVLDQQLSEFSSLGPTLDGRIKPDLVAPGAYDTKADVGIIAAKKGTQTYTAMKGTSQAAPVVSGTIALMMEGYGRAFGRAFNKPRSSSYKAILIHTANDRVMTSPAPGREIISPDTGEELSYHAGPDWATGYGMVDASKAVKVIMRKKLWRERTLYSRGARHDVCFVVRPGEDEVKATLVWDDLPASCFLHETWRKLVNNLDVVLIDPHGNRFHPWVLDPPPLDETLPLGGPDPIDPVTDIQPATRRADDRNNVEVVSIHNPVPGHWRARVTATRLPFGRRQPYSLVTSHNRLWFCFHFEPTPAGICQLYPWFCDRRQYQVPEFEERSWLVPPGSPVSLRDLCRISPGCVPCDAPAWGDCPALELTVGSLAKDARLALFDEAGIVVAHDTDGGSERTLSIAPGPPGREYFLLVTDGDWLPYDTPLRLELDLRTIE